MCDVLQNAIEEGRKEGEAEGRKKGRILSLYHDGKKTPEEIAGIMNCSLEFVEKVLKEEE